MRVLLLPCETRAREFDAKLLLACLAAGRGITSVVGSKKVMDLHLTRYRPGVYVGKSVTGRSRHNLALARAAGHRVALWDEEGLVWASREVYWRTKVDGQTLSAPELLIAWGEENARAWREHPEYAGTPIAVAGNPRVDLLRPELAGYFAAETDRIRQEHGDFVLVNTNFSRVNHVQPRQNRHLKWLREKRPADPRGGFAAHKFELFKAFGAMLPALAGALPAVRFVVRPHPSERLETWREIARGLPNVRVSGGGNVIPWIRASRGLIHNGCTTAVEAFVVGRPALAWMPVRSPDYDHPLPNGISIQLDEFRALVEAVEGLWRDPGAVFQAQAAAGGRRLIEASLAGFEGRLAGENILDALAGLLTDPAPPAGARPGLAAVSLAARRAWRAVDGRIPGHGNHRAYLEHMFPSTGPEVVGARVEAFRRCLATLPEIRLRCLQDKAFELAPA